MLEGESHSRKLDRFVSYCFFGYIGYSGFRGRYRVLGMLIGLLGWLNFKNVIYYFFDRHSNKEHT